MKEICDPRFQALTIQSELNKTRKEKAFFTGGNRGNGDNGEMSLRPADSGVCERHSLVTQFR
jgi:hypothetical protein